MTNYFGEVQEIGSRYASLMAVVQAKMALKVGQAVLKQGFYSGVGELDPVAKDYRSPPFPQGSQSWKAHLLLFGEFELCSP